MGKREYTGGRPVAQKKPCQLPLAVARAYFGMRPSVVLFLPSMTVERA